MSLNPVFVEATTLSDSWFQLIWNVLDHGRRFTIDRGSYAGTTRLEFDYITVRIKRPVSEDPLDMLPYIPDHFCFFLQCSSSVFPGNNYCGYPDGFFRSVIT